MTKTLTIRTPAGRKIAKLIWRDGVTIVECTDGIGFDVDRWVREGLDEWVSAHGEGLTERTMQEAVPRSTPSHAPEFLARLGRYLQRHLGFQTMLEDE